MPKTPVWILVAFPTALLALDDSFRAPDSVILKDGDVHRGMILQNTRDSVTIQCQFEECTFPKADVLRINDAPNVYYTDAGRTGELPSWRVIANDLRTNDRIRTLEEIPATIIDTGVFSNIPYKSFRVNRDVELNVYGDPERPAGIELGIYGNRRSDHKLRKALRAYLAGFLTSREEVAALYQLGLREGIASVGRLTIEVSPPDGPDSYGAWWISLYLPAHLKDQRLSEAEYRHLARPMEEIIGRDGRVLPGAWSDPEASKMKRKDGMVLRKGFYRDRNGTFRFADSSLPARAARP